jgi:phage baseplate assembly protein W
LNYFTQNNRLRAVFALEVIITAADPAIGVDIALNSGDLGYGQGGDLSLIGDAAPSDNVWQAINLRLITVLGTYNWQNGYGTLLGNFVDEPVTDDLQIQIEQEIKKNVLLDPRVVAITNLQLSFDSGSITVQLTVVDATGVTSSGSASVGGGSS